MEIIVAKCSKNGTFPTTFQSNTQNAEVGSSRIWPFAAKSSVQSIQTDTAERTQYVKTLAHFEDAVYCYAATAATVTNYKRKMGTATGCNIKKCNISKNTTTTTKPGRNA